MSKSCQSNKFFEVSLKKVEYLEYFSLTYAKGQQNFTVHT